MGISTRRRDGGNTTQTPQERRDDDENVPASIFDALSDHPIGTDNSRQSGREEDAPGPRDTLTAQVDVADLLRQVAEMKQQLEQSQRIDTTLMTTQVEVRPEPPKPVSYEGLPDPVVDPVAYARGIEQRIVQNINQQRDYEQGQQRSAVTREQKFQAIWDDFSDRYEDIALEPKKLEFAVKSVVDSAKARGIDLDRYMFGARERFMSDVAKEFEQTFGREEQEEDTPAPRKRGRPRNEDRTPPRRNLRVVNDRDTDDDGRTGGIFGGNESGGARTQTQSDPNSKSADMIRDLHDMQRKSGFF